MYITYLRSSSYNGFDSCEFSYYLGYTLGFQFPAGLKALLGNVCHKSLEILALTTIAKREGKDGYEDEIFGWLNVDDIDYKYSTKLAYKYYVELEPFHKHTKGDLATCIEWTKKALELSGGIFNPENLNIIQAEKKFDFEIKKPEFAYDYLLEDGTRLKGFLGLKGTIDLVCKEENGSIIFLDWKTGLRKCWNTGEEKTHKKLCKDPQLLLYFYALCHEFPETNSFLANIVFINDGGGFSIAFDRNHDLPIAEKMLLDKFNEIKNTQKPKLNKSWKCTKLCGHGKNSYSDSGKTVCQYFEPLVAEKGADKVFAEFGSLKKLTSYSDGGGRKAKQD